MMWVFFFVDERTREKMDRIIVTHICHSPRKEPEWERTRARALFLSYEITKSPSSDGPRTRVNLSLSLSLSLFLSLARAVRRKREDHAQKEWHKKSAGLRKRVHTRIQFYPPLPKEKERYIFCSDDDDEDVPVGENVFVHILRSTLRQIDVRALLLHFLSPHRG